MDTSGKLSGEGVRFDARGGEFVIEEGFFKDGLL